MRGGGAKAGALRTCVLGLSLLLGGGGCGLGLMQTAKTTPRGQLDVTMGSGFIYNELSEDRGVTLDNFPQHVQFRYGLTDQLDLGARLLLVAGALVDAKINLIDHESPLAVALSGGFGGAANLTGGGSDIAELDGWGLYLPLSAIVSYRLWDRLTPYAALGYTFCWIFDRQARTTPGEQYADRAGHGDGLLSVTGGVELALAGSLALLLEYDLYVPVVDDPGDFYAFVTNHLVQVGITF